MATYSLTYFDLRGLAENIRLVFKAAEVPFEDVRLPIDTTTWARPEFDAKKAAGDFALAMDKVPILAVTEGGVTTKFGQSKAIERFAAKRFGLFGENDLEGARIDMICEHVRDIKDAFQKEKAKGAAEGDAFLGAPLKEFFEKLEKSVDGDGFAVGKKTSLAGIIIYATLTSYFDNQAACDAAVADCPKLKAISAKVAAVPGIAKWVAERPKTAM